jgi:hypothetical protein
LYNAILRFFNVYALSEGAANGTMVSARVFLLPIIPYIKKRRGSSYCDGSFLCLVYLLVITHVPEFFFQGIKLCTVNREGVEGRFCMNNHSFCIGKDARSGSCYRT